MTGWIGHQHSSDMGQTAMQNWFFLTWLLATQAAACEGEVAGFQDLAERLEVIEEEDATILNAEFMASPGRPCREFWLIDILTEDDEVLSVLLDARTLEPRPGDMSPVAEFLRDRDEEPDEDEIWPEAIRMIGGPHADFFEGEWSDETMTGGPGPDLFVVTPGQDIITDFDPSEDLLDLGDFARLEDGFGLLRSFGEIDRKSVV